MDRIGLDWMVIILHHDQIRYQESQSLISVLTNRWAFLFQPLGDYECSCSPTKCVFGIAVTVMVVV